MGSLLKSVLSATGKSDGYPVPPSSFVDSLAGLAGTDGAQIYRLMSKANKYAGASSSRKQRKGDKYAYMAGQMLHSCGVNEPMFDHYNQAYAMGGDHGMNNDMLTSFVSGSRKEKRRQRREKKGRYESRPSDWNTGKGRKSEGDSMFDFFDSDTSSSSEEEDDDDGWFS